MRSLHFISLLPALLASSSVLADAIYKSVDSAGNVTYSSTPPAQTKAQKVDLPPPPTPAEIQAAEARQQNNARQANELEAERQERVAAEAAREAEAQRQREAQKAMEPVVIEVPVYPPQTDYYPPDGSNRPILPQPRPIPRPR